MAAHRVLVALTAAVVFPVALQAQRPGASARALGLAGAYSLAARGFEAPSWNPAVLAFPGRSRVTIGLPEGAFEFGSNSYGIGDVSHYANVHLTEADKTDLLTRIDTTLTVRAQASARPIGVSVGRFALSMLSVGEGEVGLGKDAVDLALHGNTGRSGPGQYFTAANSNASAFALTTLALSGAWPVPLSFGRLAIGMTVKRVWGQGLARGTELDSRLGVSPTLQANGSGHAIYTTYPPGYRLSGLGLAFGSNAPGSGYGVDLGGALVLPSGVTVGLVVVNAFGGMTWKQDRLRYERFQVALTQDDNGALADSTVRTVLDGAAIAGDSAALTLRQALLAFAAPARQARAAISYQAGRLLVAADLLVRVTRGLDRQPSQVISTGLEYVLWGFLPLRTGFGTDLDGAVTLSAGTGLYLGPVRFDIGAASLGGRLHHGVQGGAGLSLAFGS